MGRRRLFLSCTITPLLLLSASTAPAGHYQYRMEGTLTGIERVGIRIPGGGHDRVDVQAMYYEARDFLTPRAPGITFGGRDIQGSLEVSFTVRQVPPQRDEAAGWILVSWGFFASKTDRLIERGRSGSEESQVNEVKGLVLWHSEPEISWVDDETELTRFITEQMQFHLNDFLDEWFRDNVS